MDSKNGFISINAENIFPIIKKWLYSEKDIFLREIVSNGSDAINKLKKLVSVGEAEIPEDSQNWNLKVTLNKEAGTISVCDNGIGMTEEEVVKYINQVAFSGAKDFMEKYQGKTDDAQIIGHFGLGFYSAFMVAEKVEIDTLSWQPGATAVHWESETGMEYSLGASELTERGTIVTIHVADDCEEYLDAFKIRETLNKYFGFLPIELYFIEEGTDPDSMDSTGGSEENSNSQKPALMNNTTPLWLKLPKDCTDKDYIDFYHETFFDYEAPLFWVHLNIDYPFTLRGILYFPKLKNQYDTLEGKIKVYYNQVFVADNIKEVIPEFLMLLKGMVDCPDLPLNVSRSFLQNDSDVSKLSQHITKKVADKLSGLFNTERENYEKYWKDINPFVKYGCLKDEKFYEKVKDAILVKLTDGSSLTIKEYLEKYQTLCGDRLYYTDDEILQAQYVKMYKDAGIEPVVMDGPIDIHFMQLLEYKNSGTVKFQRIDSDVFNELKAESGVSAEELETLASKLSQIFVEYSGINKLKVKVESVKSDIPAILLLSEESRRMKELSRMYGGMDMPIEEELTLVLNGNSELVAALGKMPSAEDKELICHQIYDLAKLAHSPLTGEEMSRFIERSSKILSKFTK